MNRFQRLFTTLAGITAAAFLSFAASAPLEARGEKAPAKQASVVVHEWGTFTSFSGSDGKIMAFPHRRGDLPRFVRHTSPRSGWGVDLHPAPRRTLPGGAEPVARKTPSEMPISLETPVLYFYTDREAKLSVDVKFPHGYMTEWYPNAATCEDMLSLTWDVNLLPGAKVGIRNLDDPKATPASDATVLLPMQAPLDSHYYPARETDAVPLQVGTEYEKLLFYRGVGDFETPIQVTAKDKGRFTIKNRAKKPVSGVMLVGIEKDEVRLLTIGTMAAGEEKTATLSAKCVQSPAKLEGTMVESLVKAGLYEKEALAMVKTWKSDWFSDQGTRVLYVAPNALADEILPLAIEPKPTEIVRVLVGRHDILTPEQEKSIEESVKKIRELQARQQELAVQVHESDKVLAERFGRFKETAIQAAARNGKP